jgi:septal ring factor EnvC (AmiA/AmiB activator)
VNPSDANPREVNLPSEAEQELVRLRRQLQQRDRLVEQLSGELFRMVKSHPPALPAASSSPSSALAMVPQPPEASLRDELRQLEQQIEFYQSQIDKRDQELGRLQKSCQVLSDRNQMLERIIQELPEVYRQKFADRLEAVKSKFQTLQTENRRLQSELQQVNGRSLPESKTQRKS